MQSLTEQQIHLFKGQAHKLKPVVMIGNNGLTEAVQLEINQALTDHELIKIKISSQERESRLAFINEITQVQHATLIDQIGHIAVLYRKSNKKSKKKST